MKAESPYPVACSDKLFGTIQCIALFFWILLFHYIKLGITIQIIKKKIRYHRIIFNFKFVCKIYIVFFYNFYK